MLVNKLLRANMVEIAARRCQRAVSKLGLDHIHRLPLGCQLRGEGMAKFVRVQLAWPKESAIGFERSDLRGIHREAIPQDMLHDLARGVARNRIDDLEPLGNLLPHDMGRPKVFDHIVEGKSG